MKKLPATLFATIVVAATTCSAGESPTPQEVRKAVARSFPYLEKEGVAWMKERACISCHQLPGMVWTLGEARRRGLKIDAEKFESWNAWTLANGLRRGTYYKLTDAAFSDLTKAGVSEDDVKQIDKLKEKNFVFEADFRTALTAQWSDDANEQHIAATVKAAAKGGQGGGGGGTNNQYVALLIAGAPAAEKDADALNKTLVAGIVKSQKPDGSWPAAGQYMGQQRTAAEAIEDVTRWTAWALADVPDLSADGKAALSKSAAFLDDCVTKLADDAVQSTETLLLRAVSAHLDDKADRSRDLINRLLKMQRDDGGWSWVVDAKESSPFATGQMLYGLNYLGRDASDAATQRAVRYLLDAQGDDGVWRISMKTISASKKPDTKAGDVVYTYWATVWADIGLMQTLPE